MSSFPLPGAAEATVLAPAPGAGPGFWAGASCAHVDDDGSLIVAYRVRHGHGGNDQTLVARSLDGQHLTTIGILDERDFDAMGMERPSLARTDDGRWRLYTCCATPGAAHWWIDVLESDAPEGLAAAPPRTAFPGDDRTGVKDPIVRRTADGGWEAWVCCHLLDRPGDEDRMETRYATSHDGLTWTWHGVAISGRPGAWDARGARLTTILADGRAAYDGRASAEENWFERTGLAHLDSGAGRLVPDGDEPVADVRYLDVLALPDGGWRLFYEARLEDESHELRTELVPA